GSPRLRVRYVCDSFLRRPVRSTGTTTCLSIRRLGDRTLCVSAVLAPRHRLATTGAACPCRTARVRTPADVRTAGRVLIRAVRHPRPLQRRVARVPALVSDRWRALAVHRDLAAPIWTRRAGVVRDCHGTRDHRCGADGVGDATQGYRMKDKQEFLPFLLFALGSVSSIQ